MPLIFLAVFLSNRLFIHVPPYRDQDDSSDLPRLPIVTYERQKLLKAL